MKKFNLLLILFILTISCGSLSDAGKVMRNEKIKTTDEFLVKKKQPLVLPPDYKKIPEPDSQANNNIKTSEEEKIRKILKGPKKENTSKKNNSSIEKSILNQIRK
tara:strand:+ start:856 stop:1170 length:315 start_codon:yes stop_codon:yes gene_type:complete